MNKNFFNTIMSTKILILFVSIFSLTYSQSSDLKIFLLDQETLKSNKQNILSNNPDILPAFKTLVSYAEIALSRGPYSVTDKKSLPPSGDKHDYMSLGPYWWPDPSKPDGLPYIRKDGEVNPEVYNYTDKSSLVKMCLSVQMLALAHFFTDEERFAEHAVHLLKVWFVDEATKMNPNFKYAQSIPGRSKGRGIGLIEARHFAQLVDAIGFIEKSSFFTQEIHNKIEKWFGDYYLWIRESEQGKDEADEENNHGSWYDVQASTIALFLGKTQDAKKIIEDTKLKRIDHQIASDGSQPEELARTKTLSYSTFNLEALFSLAALSEHVKSDIWNYETPGGSSLKKALDFLLPFYIEKEKWPHKQISEFEYERGYALLLAASKRMDKKYKKFADGLYPKFRDQISNLLYYNFESE